MPRLSNLPRATALAVITALCFVAACSGGGSDKAASSQSTSPDNTDSSQQSDSSSNGDGGGGSVDACQLSESEVSAIVGFDVTLQDGGSGSSCTYAAAQSDTEHLGSSVNLTVSSFGGSDAQIDEIADQIAETLSAEIEEVSGIGDRAFFIDAGIVGELVVFDGNNQVVVAVGGLGDDTGDRKAQTVALAKELLG